MTVIVGNHDVLYRNTNEANSPENIFRGYDNITVLTSPQEVGPDGQTILLVPWINKQNQAEFFDIMAKTKSKYCFGHYEIKGFEMHKGQVADSGLSSSVFDRFHTVLSGHFHTRSTIGNITYLGSPFELTWSDYNDPRGFHVFETETGQLDYFRNPESMFFRVEYDTVDSSKNWTPYKPVSVKDKFLKIIVKNKGSAYEFDRWIKEITSYAPSDLQIIENNVLGGGTELTLAELEEQAKSNIDIIREYVYNMEIDTAKQGAVFNYLRQIYSEVDGI